jgi:2-keto-4-pentenoate hydratase
MPEDTARQAAELLVAARRTGTPLDGLPAALRPADAAAAFAIQDAVMALLGERAGGWKVGLAPGAPPSCAPLFASLIRPSPLAIPAAQVPMLGVEAEIAVRIGRDLPPRAAPYARPDIEAAIDAVCPAIEIVHSRLKGFLKATPDDKLADNVANGAFVYGAPVADWRRLDLAALRVRLEIGGKLLVDKVGGCPSGDPLVAVVWLANHLTARCGGLAAGHIVTTGSCVGMPFAQPGDAAIATFEGLGTAQVTFTR